VGPAEVESVLVAHPNVSEAAAIGVPDSIKGEALVCFCVLKKDANWSGSGRIVLAAELKENVACDLGKALAPRDVIFVGDIPKTRNAKVMRRVVRAAYLGEKLGDTSALENPASLDEIKRVARQGAFGRARHSCARRPLGSQTKRRAPIPRGPPYLLLFPSTVRRVTFWSLP